MRSYTDKSHGAAPLTPEQIEEAFAALGKTSEEERKINCFSCGFGNCLQFAMAVAQGKNHVENCVRYTRNKLALQTDELKEKNDTVRASLQYASKIQTNLLPQAEELAQVFSDYEVLWQPKDIVGGDIYWLKRFDDGALFCMGDCTGHGTPGALLSMLLATLLESSSDQVAHADTAAVLWELDAQISRALNVTERKQLSGWSRATDIQDGADLALLFLHNTGAVTFSVVGSVRMFVCDGESVQDLRGQRAHIGSGKVGTQFEMGHIAPNPKNRYYIATDGLFEQMGGVPLRPFGYKAFRARILQMHEQPIKEVVAAIWQDFGNHRGQEQYRDDVSLIGFSL